MLELTEYIHAQDEHVPFDYDSFSLIDEGVRYLNPKHFSVTQLVKIMKI